MKRKIIRYGRTVYLDRVSTKKGERGFFGKGKTTFSEAARHRMITVIDKVLWFMDIFNEDVQMVTLTVPNQTKSDRDNKRLLGDLFRGLPNTFYIWKAEKQERGAIHFHFITHGMDLGLMTERWNKYMKKSGQLGKTGTVEIFTDTIDPATKERIYYLPKTEEGADSLNGEVDGKAWGRSNNLVYAEYSEEVENFETGDNIVNDFVSFSLNDEVNNEAKKYHKNALKLLLKF